MCSGSPQHSAVNSLRWGGKAGASAAPQRWPGWEPSSLGYKHSPGPLEERRGGPVSILSPSVSNLSSFFSLFTFSAFRPLPFTD